MASYEPINADSTFKRSTWNPRPVRWSSDMRHGYLYPAQILEVLPSDIIECDFNYFTRMQPPIAPVFGDIYQHVAAFFCPKRVIFNKTKQFYGEAETFGVATTISEPTSTADDYIVTRSYLDGPDKWCTFGSAFGLVTNESAVPAAASRIPINKLPIYAFAAIYNEYFRNENYQAKYMWNKDSTGNSTTGGYLTYNGVNVTAKSDLPRVNKGKDIFTSILPYALKNSAGSVSLPLGDKAPLTSASTYNTLPNSTGFGLKVSGSSTAKLLHIDNYDNVNTEANSATNPAVVSTNLYADLSKASAASLSSLIYALSYQLYLSKLAKGGSKYGEYLEVMFGAKCPAATRDEPEFLGHYSYRLNIDTVLQTTGHADSTSSELGATGANSQTGGKSKSFFHFAATEPGYLIIVTYTKHTRSYSTSMNPVFLKKDLLDYYQTPFANAPDVAMDSELMYFTGNVSTRKNLGFCEPWLDYKHFNNQVFGGLNPMNSNSFDFWTLADKYDNQPTITSDFLFEDRLAIARALTSGSSGTDYICDLMFNYTLSRTMPLYSSGLGQL